MSCSYNLLSFLCFCACFFHIYGQNQICTTPNGESATCIPLNRCKILYDAVTTRDTQQLKFLKESQCGYRRQPFVCCGSHDNYHREDDLSGNRRTGDNWGDEDNWGNNNNNNNNGNTWDSNENNDEFNGGNRPGQNSNNGFPDRSSCGIQAIDRILDGEVTDLMEFPWMALLQYRKKTGDLAFSCGGSLISSRYVLTAAHCVRGQILTKIGPLVNVRLGEYNTDTDRDCKTTLGFERCNDKPVDVDVQKTIPHPDYRDSSADRYHDIALIKLARNVPNSDFIKPICLPSGSETTRVGQKMVVAGWGRTEYANSSPVKLKLWVPIAEKSQCTSTFRSAGVNLSNNQLCAGGERGRDSCNGDSGGPLMATIGSSAQWYLEGIVSFGARCGSEGWPGIYTKVEKYNNWIRKNAV